MVATGLADDQRFREQLAELQTRVDILEDIVLSEAADSPYAEYVAESAPPQPRASNLVAEQQAAPEDAEASLRALQLEATADLHQDWEDATETSSEAGRSFDLAYIEERLAGRVLALAGGTALVLGAIFFLSLAFSRGWIGPGMQVVLGVAAGSIGLLIGAVLLLRGDRLVGHVLTAVGIAVVSLSFFAATTLYELVPPIVGLGGAFLAAALAAIVAIATRSQIVAAFGLVAVLAAPPILGAEANAITFIYMVAALAGIAAVSLWQTWSWLPPLAFVISAPQIYAWIETGPGDTMGAAALLLYWALMAAAAGGEAYRRKTQALSLSSAPLLMTAGAFVVVLAFDLLATDMQRVTFLLTLASLHGAIAAFFMTRRGPVDPFGLLAGAYGVGIASMAVPLMFGASMTAVVWSVEAAALAVLAGRRAHGPSLISALVLLIVAGSRLAWQVAEARSEWPYELPAVLGPFDSLVIGLAVFVVAAVVFVTVVPVRSVRLTVVAIAVVASLPIVYQELAGVPFVAATTVLALVAATASRWLDRLPTRPITWQMGPALEWLRPKKPVDIEVEALPLAAAAAAGLMALAGTVAATLEQSFRPEVPFTDAAGIASIIIAAGCLVAGLLSSGRLRRWGIISGGAVIALSVLFQLPIIWVVVVWAVLAVLGFALNSKDAQGTFSYGVAASVALGAVALAALVYAPPDRLLVGPLGLAPHPPFISEATLVLGALAIVLALAAWMHRPNRWAGLALGAAGATVLYLLSVNIVDLFAAQAYELAPRQPDRLADLAKQAQVALSVLWTIVGVIVVAAGLALKQSALRVGGLAILGLATVKVFLIDLASLDLAYRVTTLLVLGLVLMASAYAWTRMKPSSEEAEAPVASES